MLKLSLKLRYFFLQRRTKKDGKSGVEDHRESQKTRRGEDAVRLRLRSLDRFQMCLAACRTSSASVRHENTYKDPDSKHCYSLNYQRNRRDDFNNNNDGNARVVVTSSSTLKLLIRTIPRRTSDPHLQRTDKNFDLSSVDRRTRCRECLMVRRRKKMKKKLIKMLQSFGIILVEGSRSFLYLISLNFSIELFYLDIYPSQPNSFIP